MRPASWRSPPLCVLTPARVYLAPPAPRWSIHALEASLGVLLSLDFWFCMVVHVCLCVTFWHCERSAAALAAGRSWPGSSFCKVGYRQQWPGEFSSLNVKGIEQQHFWEVCGGCLGAIPRAVFSRFPARLARSS